MELDFSARFEGATDLVGDGDQLHFLLTLSLEGISAAEFRSRQSSAGLSVGYRLLHRTSISEPVFEHRASLGASYGDQDITLHLWVPLSAFEADPVHLVSVNCLVEGQYWFDEHGRPPTYLALCYHP